MCAPLHLNAWVSLVIFVFVEIYNKFIRGIKGSGFLAQHFLTLFLLWENLNIVQHLLADFLSVFGVFLFVPFIESAFCQI